MNFAEILDFVQRNYLVLVAAFLLAICAIILARIILTFLLNRAYGRYLAIKNTGKKILSAGKKIYVKEDEVLMRDKFNIPRAHSEVKAELQEKNAKKQAGQNYEVLDSNDKEWDRQELNSTQIVDIVKPVGFWTSMILGQKLTYLVQSANIINQRGQKGFWVSMIEAKERAAGKQHARGR